MYKNASFLSGLSVHSDKGQSAKPTLQNQSTYLSAHHSDGSNLIDKLVALIEEGTDVLIRVIIHQDLLVSQLSLVKTWNDRAGVQYMRDAFALKAVQIASSPNWTCSTQQVVPGKVYSVEERLGETYKGATYMQSRQYCTRLSILRREPPHELQLLYSSFSPVAILHDTVTDRYLTGTGAKCRANRRTCAPIAVAD